MVFTVTPEEIVFVPLVLLDVSKLYVPAGIVCPPVVLLKVTRPVVPVQSFPVGMGGLAVQAVVILPLFTTVIPAPSNWKVLMVTTPLAPLVVVSVPFTVMSPCAVLVPVALLKERLLKVPDGINWPPLVREKVTSPTQVNPEGKAGFVVAEVRNVPLCESVNAPARAPLVEKTTDASIVSVPSTVIAAFPVIVVPVLVRCRLLNVVAAVGIA